MLGTVCVPSRPTPYKFNSPVCVMEIFDLLLPRDALLRI